MRGQATYVLVLYTFVKKNQNKYLQFHPNVLHYFHLLNLLSNGKVRMLQIPYTQKNTGEVHLKIAFYGVARQVGTSANMAAIAAGLTHYYQIPVQISEKSEEFIEQKEAIQLMDCSRKTEAEAWQIANTCDLFVINFLNPNSKLEDIYSRYSLVRKNILFLIGKYYHNSEKYFQQIAKQYRLENSRVCAIPYNIRFQSAYENQNLSEYLREQENVQRNYEDEIFQKNLLQVLQRVLLCVEKL